MWLTPHAIPQGLEGLPGVTYLGMGLMLIGFVLDAYAAWMFIVAKTTISPLSPHNASVLLDRGLYRFSRNPMYLGMAVMLLGWALVLENVLAIYGPVIYVLYITRFQILPEERILKEKWGQKYIDYLAHTRRWL